MTEYKYVYDDYASVIINSYVVHVNNINNIYNIDYTHSQCLRCKIDDELIENPKYRKIIHHIYKKINCKTTIIKNTKLNIKTFNKTDQGYYYIDDIGISVQGVDSNKSIEEIINQCGNNIKCEMKIKLKNGKNIYLNN